MNVRSLVIIVGTMMSLSASAEVNLETLRSKFIEVRDTTCTSFWKSGLDPADFKPNPNDVFQEDSPVARAIKDMDKACLHRLPAGTGLQILNAANYLRQYVLNLVIALQFEVKSGPTHPYFSIAERQFDRLGQVAEKASAYAWKHIDERE